MELMFKKLKEGKPISDKLSAVILKKLWLEMTQAQVHAYRDFHGKYGCMVNKLDQIAQFQKNMIEDMLKSTNDAPDYEQMQKETLVLASVIGEYYNQKVAGDPILAITGQI